MTEVFTRAQAQVSTELKWRGRFICRLTFWRPRKRFVVNSHAPQKRRRRRAHSGTVRYIDECANSVNIQLCVTWRFITSGLAWKHRANSLQMVQSVMLYKTWLLSVLHVTISIMRDNLISSHFNRQVLDLREFLIQNRLLQRVPQQVSGQMNSVKLFSVRCKRIQIIL